MKHKFRKSYIALGVMIVLCSILALAVIHVYTQNQSTKAIAERLRQQGVPIKEVNTISRIPYEIEIDLQSTSDNDRLAFEDNWFKLLASREATFAYRNGIRINGFNVNVYNANGELIASTTNYLYPGDPNQQIAIVKKPKVDDQRAKRIITSKLKLGILSLDDLLVITDPKISEFGQILYIQISSKDIYEANQSLSGFMDNLEYVLRTINKESGTNIILCHFRLLDKQGSILYDYVTDLEGGYTQSISTKGLKDNVVPPPSLVPTEPSLLVSTPTQDAYPPPGAPLTRLP